MPKRGLQLAAGGHLGYGALGTLYTNAPPNHPHVYGPVYNQVAHLPNHGIPGDEYTNDRSRSYMPAKSAAREATTTTTAGSSKKIQFSFS